MITARSVEFISVISVDDSEDVIPNAEVEASDEVPVGSTENGAKEHDFVSVEEAGNQVPDLELGEPFSVRPEGDFDDLMLELTEEEENVVGNQSTDNHKNDVHNQNEHRRTVTALQKRDERKKKSLPPFIDSPASKKRKAATKVYEEKSEARGNKKCRMCSVVLSKKRLSYHIKQHRDAKKEWCPQCKRFFPIEGQHWAKRHSI